MSFDEIFDLTDAVYLYFLYDMILLSAVRGRLTAATINSGVVHILLVLDCMFDSYHHVGSI